ncbi:MAG: hypothetical protein RLZZ230_267 [Candidatus Parcubacteria bacterium]|jgi:hypothetical protein
MYTKLTNVISESGIWNGNQKETHAFLLSPSVYKIDESQKLELTQVGSAIYDCMLGLSHIAVIAYDQSTNYGGAWLLARKVFSTGVPKIYQELQGMNVRHVAKLLKVDFMIDINGQFKIAEVDGHNKHGLGYSTIGLRFREALYPEAKSLPGAVKALSEEINRLGHNEIKLFYADQERFYIPEFEVASQEFKKHGISCRLVSEMAAEKSFLQQGLFLDLPFLYHRIDLYPTIISAYKAGTVEFIIPPKPFLGAKGVLALLRNDGKDEQVESLLRSFIKNQSLDLVRQYIPETVLVGKQATRFDSAMNYVAGKRYVLKESISSGMKGVHFSDDENFKNVLANACQQKMNWVLQEEIENQPQTFSWYENNGAEKPELKTANDWSVRVTVQYINRQLGDVIVTARRDKSVHGAKDCLQIGTIVL